jgi:hypothetical protein
MEEDRTRQENMLRRLREAKQRDSHRNKKAAQESNFNASPKNLSPDRELGRMSYPPRSRHEHSPSASSGGPRVWSPESAPPVTASGGNRGGPITPVRPLLRRSNSDSSLQYQRSSEQRRSDEERRLRTVRTTNELDRNRPNSRPWVPGMPTNPSPGMPGSSQRPALSVTKSSNLVYQNTTAQSSWGVPARGTNRRDKYDIEMGRLPPESRRDV